MPKTRANVHIANAVKDQGTSKRRTKEITDQARPRGVRKPVSETVTGQGGARKDRGRTRGPHPGTRGGVHADTRSADATGERIPLAKRRIAGRHEDDAKREDLRRAGIGTKRREKNRGRQTPHELGERRTGEKRGPGLTKAPSRGRMGSDAVGGRTRTGRDRTGRRGRTRKGSRTRGRAPGR